MLSHLEERNQGPTRPHVIVVHSDKYWRPPFLYKISIDFSNLLGLNVKWSDGSEKVLAAIAKHLGLTERKRDD